MSFLAGSILKEERKKRALSQKELAHQIDVSPAYINLIENGHRPLTPQLKSDICRVLEIDAERLDGEDNKEELQRLKYSTYFSGHDETTLERLVVEMPDIVANILRLEEELSMSKMAFERVTERMQSDENLSENIHDLLSIATSIRSSSSILNSQGDLSQEHRSQFNEAIDHDARQLSDQLRALVDYLDHDTRSDAYRMRDEIRLIQYCEDHLYYFEDLEEGRLEPAELQNWIRSTLGDELAKTGHINRLFQLFLSDIRAVPRDEFLKAVGDLNWDILALAQRFDCSVDRILRRVAMLSRFGDFSNMALLIQDHAGQFLLESSAMSGHRNVKIDCPFWPIFNCERDRGHLFKATVKISHGNPMQAAAAAHLWMPTRADQRPWVIRTMIVYRDQQDAQSAPIDKSAMSLGFNCRDCKILDCDARRNQSISIITDKNNNQRGVN